MIKFFDTNILLEMQEELLKEDKFIISFFSLVELENIKTSKTKDETIKYQARKVLKILDQNPKIYVTASFAKDYDTLIKDYNLPNTTDSKIILDALFYSEPCIFVTNDLACKTLAQTLCLITDSYNKNEDDYTGFKEIEMNDNELNDFYTHILPNHENLFNLLDNEYLLIKYQGNIEDKYKWAGDAYYKVPFNKIESKMFGKITPKDIYQQCAIDSMVNNQITIMRGPAGSGKDYLGLGYLFHLLERGAIDRIYIFVNPVATRGAAKLGYLPGDKNAKILDSQIGNFLIGKLGDIEIVYQMIDKGQLVLMPMSDIRGVDLSGTRASLYITEAQNMNIDMMKLALQRVGEDTLVILNGDTECQVDLVEYSGNNNGLRRVSEVFRGQEYYGEVNLKEIYRSEIARRADNM